MTVKILVVALEGPQDTLTNGFSQLITYIQTQLQRQHIKQNLLILKESWVFEFVNTILSVYIFSPMI